MHEFVNRLHRNDRVLLVGDRRQHEAVEAGRPFAQLQDAGMRTVKLEEIVRQTDPELKQVVEQLARGDVRYHRDMRQDAAHEGLHLLSGSDLARTKLKRHHQAVVRVSNSDLASECVTKFMALISRES